MGKLVHFDRRGRRPKLPPVQAGNAQIFLFTGVRYERDGTPIPSKPAPTTSGARRKRV